MIESVSREKTHVDGSQVARVAPSSFELRSRSRWLERNVLPHEITLRKWLQSRDLAGLEIEDIIQETYSRILALDTFDHISKPRAYAFQVAYSIVLDHVRRLKVVAIDAVPDLDAMSDSFDAFTPEVILSARQDLKRLAHDLAALPDRVREVFQLRRIDGISQRETAFRLGIAESTVEKHMARGLVMMADWFGLGGYSGAPTSSCRTPQSNRRDDPRKP